MKDEQCPDCGAKEMHKDGDKLHLRMYKVHSDGHWWSQCLVCAGYYDKPDGTYADEAGDPEKGWF